MLLILGVYYITTLLSGAGGAKVWSVGPHNLLISGAEFMGFAGLLPPRQEVRELVKAGFAASIDLRVLLFPGLLAALYVALGANWLKQGHSTPRWIWACTAVLIGSYILLTIAASSVGFPFWGRHLAAAFPAFAVIAGWMAHLGWRSKGVMPFASVAYGAALLCSSVFLRISDVHAKDDYREASRLATAAISEGKVVWWSADPPAASYYIPDMQSLIANKTLILTFGPEAPPIERRPDPQMIILSKPDIYDPNRIIRNRGEREGLKCTLTLKGFEVWQK